MKTSPPRRRRWRPQLAAGLILFNAAAWTGCQSPGRHDAELQMASLPTRGLQQSGTQGASSVVTAEPIESAEADHRRIKNGKARTKQIRGPGDAGRRATDSSRVQPASFHAQTYRTQNTETDSGSGATAAQLAPAPTDLRQPTDAVDPAFSADVSGLQPSEIPATDAGAAAPLLDAQDIGTSLEELQQLAATNNPSIAQAAAAVRRLHGKWTQVGLRPNPTLGYMGSEIGNDGQAGQQGMYVGQTYVRGGKLALNRNVVCQEIQQAEQMLAAQYKRVATDVRSAFYDVVVAQQRQQLAEQLADVSARAVKTSESLVAAQEVSQVALLQSELQAQEVAILRQRATNTYDAAWRRLAAVVGIPSLVPRRLASDNFEAIDSLSWEDNVQRILSEHPEIASAITNVQRTRAELSRAVVEPIQNVSVQLAVQYDDSTEDVVTGVQVGVPIPIWNRNQGGICEARAAVIEAERQLDTLELSLQEKLANQFKELASAQFELGRYADQILPRARRTMELITKAYAAGEVGYLEQLAAQRTFFQTNLAYLDSQQAYWQAITQIDGMLLTNSLQ